MNRYAFFRSVAFLLALCALLLLPVSAAPADETLPSIELTQEELAYRDRVGEIVIGCPVNDCPVLFQDERTGQLKGISIDILDMVSEMTGLTFRYQALPSGSVTYEDIQRLGLDMLASVEHNAINEQSMGIALTDPYLHAAKVFVCKKGTQFRPDGAMTIAVNSGSQTLEKVIRQQYPRFQLLYCDSTEEAFSALLSGRADAMLQNQYTVERLLRKPIYENLQIVASAAIGDSQCLACVVPVGEDRQNIITEDTALLLSIINKGVDALDQGQVSFLIIKETAENAYQFTVWDTLYRYRFLLLGLLASLLLILVLLRKNRILHRKHAEQAAAQKRAKELADINARMGQQQLLLVDALKRAEEASRVKSSFLFNMSHDIRTPMNAILGFTKLAWRDREDPEKLKNCLEKIQVSGDQLLGLINDVLEMTKLDNGKITLTEERCDLVEHVKMAAEPFREEIEEKHLSVRTDTSDVQNGWVRCDGRQLDQILFNLLSNAVKFSRPGGKVLVTLSQRSMGEYATYEIHVKDNGIGMSEEFLAHVFEPFERERTSTISHTQGTGLGLSIAKSLVELMGGDIQVSSESDQGTDVALRFTFKLQEQAPRATSGEDVSDADFAGKRLLLVDDNELNTEIARELLLEMGFQVETAENGQDAVELVRQAAVGHYDAILMDIQMPVMDGYQASREIRRLGDKGKLPIIALTANAFDEDKMAALASGMNAHIAKPLDMAVLCETLRTLLENR